MLASSELKKAFSPVGHLQRPQHMTEKPNKNEGTFHFSPATVFSCLFERNFFYNFNNLALLYIGIHEYLHYIHL